MANIIISPSKYVQGKGELANIAEYAVKLGKKPFILISASGIKRVGDIIKDSFKDTDSELVFEEFHGECSKNEINRLLEAVKANGFSTRSHISECCSEKTKRKSAYGFIWKYKID